MKINWNAVIVDMDNKPLKADGDKDLTLAKVAINALSQLTQADASLSGEEKFLLGALAYKIHNEPEAEYEVEEISKVKQRIGNLYAPSAVFQAYNLLK